MLPVVGLHLTRPPAQYGDRTQDGIVLIMHAAEEQVRAAVRQAFVANGFEVTPRESDGLMESIERRLEGDTTLVVRAEIMPEDQSGGGVVVVLSGDYTLRGNSRRSRVIQRPGERSALYARLGAIADSTRRLVKVVPQKDAASDAYSRLYERQFYWQ